MSITSDQLAKTITTLKPRPVVGKNKSNITPDQLVKTITTLKHRPVLGKLTMTIVETIETTQRPVDSFVLELEAAITKHSTGVLLNKLDMMELDRLRMINHSKRILQQPWPKHLNAIRTHGYVLKHIEAHQRVTQDIALCNEQDVASQSGYCTIL